MALTHMLTGLVSSAIKSGPVPFTGREGQSLRSHRPWSFLFIRDAMFLRWIVGHKVVSCFLKGGGGPETNVMRASFESMMYGCMSLCRLYHVLWLRNGSLAITRCTRVHNHASSHPSKQKSSSQTSISGSQGDRVGHTALVPIDMHV